MSNKFPLTKADKASISKALKNLDHEKFNESLQGVFNSQKKLNLKELVFSIKGDENDTPRRHCLEWGTIVVHGVDENGNPIVTVQPFCKRWSN
jgi:hypothetical protein